MHVAVAIVGFRNVGDIVGCLAALEKQTYADFEVTICENGGAAAFEALRQAAPERLAGGQPVRVIDGGANLGFPEGTNVAMRAVQDADAWWVLNPDTEPEPEALAALVSRLQQGDCDAIGGVLYGEDRVVQSYGGRWNSWLARAESIGWGRPLTELPDRRWVEGRQHYIVGASMFIGRRYLERAGPMRGDYFIYCEEVEWCLRGRAAGLRLGFAPGARVMHRQGATTGSASGTGARESRLAVWLKARNQVLVSKDCFASRAPLASVGALVTIFLRWGRRGAWREVGYALAGWGAGMLGRRGPPPFLTP